MRRLALEKEKIGRINNGSRCKGRKTINHSNCALEYRMGFCILQLIIIIYRYKSILMKVVLLTTDYHLSANIGIKAFLNDPKIKNGNIEVVGLIVADQFNFRVKTLRKTIGYFKKLNFAFFLKQIFATLWDKMKIVISRYFLTKANREYFGIEEMAEENSIPYLQVHSINSAEAIEFIEAQKPDLLISCFLLEIVQEKVLKIPTQGAINVHPALTQQHRGIFTSFWTLLNNWKKGGATVHYMTKKIDDGKVIVQKHFFVHPSDTLHSVNKKAAELGGRLLAKAVVKIKNKQALRFKLKKLGKMFSSPTSLDVENFYAKGRRLINLREFFTL